MDFSPKNPFPDSTWHKSIWKFWFHNDQKKERTKENKIKNVKIERKRKQEPKEKTILPTCLLQTIIRYRPTDHLDSLDWSPQPPNELPPRNPNLYHKVFITKPNESCLDKILTIIFYFSTSWSLSTHFITWTQSSTRSKEYSFYLLFWASFLISTHLENESEYSEETRMSYLNFRKLMLVKLYMDWFVDMFYFNWLSFLW